MDCTAVLNHVLTTESSLGLSSDQPTTIDVLQVEHVFLVLSRTKYACSAQLALADTMSALDSPVIVWESSPEEEKEGGNGTVEEITSCAVLALESEVTDSWIHVAVLLGTHLNRVLAIQLQIRVWSATKNKDSKYVLQVTSDDLDPFEPLPLHEPVQSSSHGNNDSGHGSKHGSKRGSKHGGESMMDISTHSEAHATPRKSQQHRRLPRQRSRSMSFGSLDVSTHGKSPSRSSSVAAEQVKEVPFNPKGGVKSICPYAEGTDDMIVWIAYGDGTAVRLPHCAFFPTEIVPNDLLLASRAVRAKLVIPSSFDGTIIPLPFSHLTLLSQPRALETDPAMRMSSTVSDTEAATDEDSDTDNEFFEAISYGDAAPAMSFYSNEDQLYSKIHDTKNDFGEDESDYYGHLKDSLIGGTRDLAKGMFGGVMGAVQWGLSSSRRQVTESDNQDDLDLDSNEEGEGTHHDRKHMPYLELKAAPKDLPLGYTLFDGPRRFTDIAIDTEGNLAAAADNLGRVQLIDLATKQTIRMWKGFRDASCFWIQMPRPGEENNRRKRNLLYLAIHGRQRGIVEVFRVRHGPRVTALTVKKDAQLVQCFLPAKDGLYSKCFLVQSDRSGKKTTMEVLDFKDETLHFEASVIAANNQSPDAVDPKHYTGQNTLQLRLLQQLLAIETNVQSDVEAVFVALTQISSLPDLCKALDLLAVASHLEEGMGVEGSSFHAEVVGHCKIHLDVVLSDEQISTSHNPYLEALMLKLEFHSQLIAAYDVLNKFETDSYSDDEDDVEINTPRTPWAVEGVAWMETYVAVTKQGMDFGLRFDDGTFLTFSAFAKSFLQDEQQGNRLSKSRNEHGQQKMYLCDSTKDRKTILLHIFRPLLRDIFVFKVVNSIFECMGIKDDHEKLQQYFGEWFVSLPMKAASQASLFGLWCPSVRWLHDIISASIKRADGDPSKVSGYIYLKSLHNFCAEASDLPRAFLLAIVCWEAVSSTTKQYEAKTYGMIRSADAVKPWEELIRKIRVCLLMSLHLVGVNLGPLPLNVTNIEDGNIFCVYEWLARDELSFSHKQDEIVALEEACRCSEIAFDPSSPEGDQPPRWKLLQKSCKLLVAENDRKGANFIPDENSSGPMLLFLNDYNKLTILAAHRSLLLAGMWSQNPSSLDRFWDSLSAIRSIESGGVEFILLAAALRLEIWQVNLRPIFRAFLFGFDDVPELSEEAMAPLYLDNEWLRDVTQIALDVLALTERTGEFQSGATLESILGADVYSSKGKGWPPIQMDFVLEGILRRSRSMSQPSIDVHRSILCAAQLSDDIYSLSLCIPSFDEAFLPEALCLQEPEYSYVDYQTAFINDAVWRKAETSDGVAIDLSDLDDILRLGKAWYLEMGSILTRFLIAMYQLGKDSMIEDLANACALDVDVPTFLEGGLAIASIRLNATMSVLKKKKQFRPIIALLDADTTAWVKETAHTAIKERPSMRSLGKDGKLPNLSATHGLILRMLRMSSESRGEAHALSIMSGTLLSNVPRSERSAG